MNQRKLLAVVAHPDDESGSFGGTLALYAGRGAAVEIVCATCGEAARNRGQARSREELCETRRREFRAACGVLGAAWSDIWDYPDGALNRQTFHDLGLRICRVIRERRPDVVITQGPEGGLTGHADHAAIACFATFAFHAAGRTELFPECGAAHQAARLYHATAPAPLPAYRRVCLSPVDAVMDISETFERKFEAFQRHQTQAPLYPRFRTAVEKLGPREYFHLAACISPPPPASAHDLFAGL